MASLWVPSGDQSIDRIRQEVLEEGTDGANYLERLAALTTWLHLLQRQGVDVSAYIPICDRLAASAANGDQTGLYAAVDDGFAVLGGLQAGATDARSPDVRSGEAGAGHRLPGDSSELLCDWPVYGGNVYHTGSIDEPGPREGRLAWRFPVGLAWYARPAVENRRVYAPSPGMRTLLYCLDLDSGACLWKTWRRWSSENLEGACLTTASYKTPAVASTPVLLPEVVVLNEFGAQGTRFGARCLTFVGKESGRILRRVPAGQADYRVGYVPLVSEGSTLVYPDGTQRIGDMPPQSIGQHRIVCSRASDGEMQWSFHVGPLFAEPVIADGRVYIGTADGVFFCLNLDGAIGSGNFDSSDLRRVAWQFKAGGATNAAAAVDEQLVFFGANDGCIYCLHKATGALIWKTEVPEREPRSFRLFSQPRVSHGRLYVGSAARRLYCLDAVTGAILWSYRTADWIRSRPCLDGDRVLVAAMDGTLYCLRDQAIAPEELWQTKVGTHPVYADLVAAGDRVLLTSSDLYLWCLDTADGHLCWRHSLLETAWVGGREIRADEMGGGGYYQSKPTAAGGKVFVGTPSRFVYALDWRTGKELWRFEMGGAVSAAPAYSDGKVLAGQQGGEEHFYCLDAETGQLVWKQAVGWVWSSANVADGRVFTCGVDGYLTCLDENDGHIIWRYRTARGAYPEPPIEGKRVYFGSWDHFVYALDVATGQLLWQFHTGGTMDSGAPIAYQGRLYLPMRGKRLCCLDAATGERIWEYTIDEGCMNASPALWQGRLFISQSVRHGAIPVASLVRCLDAESGRIIWEHKGGGITGPSVAGGRVYVASTSDPYFYCLDADGNGDGTTTCFWRYDMGERVYESVPAIYGGQAYILSESGYLYALA